MTTAGPGTLADVAAWQERLAALSATWSAGLAAERAEDAALVPQWQQRVGQVREHQAALVQSGRWRGGPRTLLAALDLQYRELVMTAGLAWLLRPDGHHGLGGSVLASVLSRLGVRDAETGTDVQLVLEEAREETRADLVAYGSTWTLVVEAKVFAAEQREQLDRLHQHWAHEPGARFVFLTRGARTPVSNIRSSEAWATMTWADIAGLVKQAAHRRGEVAPGVYEYLNTLEAYHSD